MPTGISASTPTTPAPLQLGKDIVLQIGFKDLKLEGSFIREIRFVPSRSLHIEVRSAPQGSETRVSILYGLVFDQVRCFRCDLEAEPWLEIRSHSIVESSDYLKRHMPQKRGEIKDSFAAIEAEVRHFQLILEEGEIDIIAEHFSASALEEIPLTGVAKIQAEEHQLQDHPIRTAEQRCSFCGKTQSEVSKLVTSDLANILSIGRIQLEVLDVIYAAYPELDHLK